jgi:hypothetical protein
MARRLTRIRIFVASPSGVREERAGLAQIVDELNRTVCVDINTTLGLSAGKLTLLPIWGVRKVS